MKKLLTILLLLTSCLYASDVWVSTWSTKSKMGEETYTVVHVEFNASWLTSHQISFDQYFSLMQLDVSIYTTDTTLYQKESVVDTIITAGGTDEYLNRLFKVVFELPNDSYIIKAEVTDLFTGETHENNPFVFNVSVFEALPFELSDILLAKIGEVNLDGISKIVPLPFPAKYYDHDYIDNVIVYFEVLYDTLVSNLMLKFKLDVLDFDNKHIMSVMDTSFDVSKYPEKFPLVKFIDVSKLETGAYLLNLDVSSGYSYVDRQNYFIVIE